MTELLIILGSITAFGLVFLWARSIGRRDKVDQPSRQADDKSEG